MSCCALLGCTPEATVIDAPNGGASGVGGGKGDGGKAGRPPVGSGGAPSGECAVVESDQPDCADCLARECAQEVEACAGTDCLCGDYLGSTGQINCILACPNLSAKLDSVNACAQQCGFEDLRHMEPHAHDLWDCLVNPPGPPVCPSCVSPPQ
jgi:hypothetical protein